MKIWVNTIVHNEENFIWFAIMSVVDFVDKVLVYDSGSTDKTVRIIKEIQKIKGKKIKFSEIGAVNKYQFTKARQEMLDRSNCDWILIVDGDEIWPNESIKKLTDKINRDGKNLDGIVVPYYVNIGDIYHYQEEKAGQYKLLGKKGHLSLRAISKDIPGLHVDLPYGMEGYFDENNLPIHERKDCVFLNSPYFHTTHLKRSTKTKEVNKFKYELGKGFPKGFFFPEVLSKLAPKIVPSPWKKRSKVFYLVAFLLTPLRKIKRRLSFG